MYVSFVAGQMTHRLHNAHKHTHLDSVILDHLLIYRKGQRLMRLKPFWKTTHPVHMMPKIFINKY